MISEIGLIIISIICIILIILLVKNIIAFTLKVLAIFFIIVLIAGFFIFLDISKAGIFDDQMTIIYENDTQKIGGFIIKENTTISLSQEDLQNELYHNLSESELQTMHIIITGNYSEKDILEKDIILTKIIRKKSFKIIFLGYDIIQEENPERVEIYPKTITTRICEYFYNR